ncbi:MAG TPA: tetratricopeptide repeat protein [Myxococcales bacterium]|jgi:tetratricopeptide (TPR) repeat protein
MAESTKSDKSKPQDWKQVLYTEDRVKKWAKGEMTLAELDGISGPEMLEMAVTGFAMYEQGRYREAKVIFEGLAALDPTESYYRTALGAVYLAQDKLDEASAEFDAAIKLNKKDIAALVNRGEVRLRKGQLLEAAEDFKSAVDLDPENKDPLSLRARALAAAALETLKQRGLTDGILDDEPKPGKKGKPARK